MKGMIIKIIIFLNIIAQKHATWHIVHVHVYI